MRGRSIASEAWRNLSTGTTAAALLAVVLAAGLTALTVLDARTVVEDNQSLARWRGVGASIVTIQAEAEVDGAACEALDASPRVRAAGAGRALREGLALVALPGASPPLWEVTPGLATLLTTQAQGWPDAAIPTGAASVNNGGLVLSQSLAEALGRGPGGTIATAAGPAQVAGVFPVPDDGRDSRLSYAALAPVSATGLFDFCWAEVWPPDEATAGALRATIALSAPPETRVTVQQLNPSLGTTIDPVGRYQQRLTRNAPLAAAILGLAIGFVSIRRRRLELASALHAGVTRRALTAQLVLETAVWTVAAVLLTAPFAWWAATAQNPYPAGPVLAVAAAIIAAGALGTGAGALLGVARTRESHLFRYFKTRT